MEIPKQIREYEILDVIGKGGMGVIYRARHKFLNEERAIKVVHASFSSEEGKELVERFILEAKLLTRLRHPNLILLYDFGILKHMDFFMVMELVQGESVLARIKRLGRIPMDESIRIVRQAALGLNHAHQQGIIHRDISPDNLLIVKQDDSTEITKVIDFGIAKVLIGDALTKPGFYLGKPHYSSPERLEKTAVRIDQRSDIYSLGITLYHMLTGVVPFEGNEVLTVIQKVLMEAPKPPSFHFPKGEFPEALDRLITKAIAKKPEDRHPSMERLIQELDEVMSPPESPQDVATLFFSRIGHEMRTRIDSIIGYSELLQEDASKMGNQHMVNDLKNITAAGKHLLWFIEGTELTPDLQPLSTWSQSQRARYWYERKEWEKAIEGFELALQESVGDKSLQQWLSAAETRLNTERQVRTQLILQLEECRRLLDDKKIIEARSVVNDIERNFLGNYRLDDLRQQWDVLLQRLKQEIEEVIKEQRQVSTLKQQCSVLLQYLQALVPPLRATLESLGMPTPAVDATSVDEQTTKEFVIGLRTRTINRDDEEKS